MDLPEAIEQAKEIKVRLNRADLTHISKEDIDFRLKSVRAIDVILNTIEKRCKYQENYCRLLQDPCQEKSCETCEISKS